MTEDRRRARQVFYALTNRDAGRSLEVQTIPERPTALHVAVTEHEDVRHLTLTHSEARRLVLALADWLDEGDALTPTQRHLVDTYGPPLIGAGGDDVGDLCAGCQHERGGHALTTGACFRDYCPCDQFREPGTAPSGSGVPCDRCAHAKGNHEGGARRCLGQFRVYERLPAITAGCLCPAYVDPAARGGLLPDAPPRITS